MNSGNYENVCENLKKVRMQIREAEQKAGRPQGSVKLMAVSKFHPDQAVLKAIEAQQLLFGENRVQEACSKFPELIKNNPDIELHMIGQLQTNKVRHAVEIAKCIESVDRIPLLDEIEKQCQRLNKTIKILFEYHTGEESKSGFTDMQELTQALENFKQGKYVHIIPAGFMTMAPFVEDKDIIRKSFITLRTIAQQMQEKYPQFDLSELSMGMSGDYEIAIEEGSTLVRIGTAIFGQREY